MQTFRRLKPFRLFILLGLGLVLLLAGACAEDPQSKRHGGKEPPPLEPPICPTGMTIIPTDCVDITTNWPYWRDGWVHLSWTNNSDDTPEIIFLRIGLGTWGHPWTCDMSDAQLSAGTTSYDYHAGMNQFPCDIITSYVYSYNDAGECIGTDSSDQLIWADMDDLCKHHPP